MERVLHGNDSLDERLHRVWQALGACADVAHLEATAEELTHEVRRRITIA